MSDVAKRTWPLKSALAFMAGILLWSPVSNALYDKSKPVYARIAECVEFLLPYIAIAIAAWAAVSFYRWLESRSEWGRQIGIAVGLVCVPPVWFVVNEYQRYFLITVASVLGVLAIQELRTKKTSVVNGQLPSIPNALNGSERTFPGPKSHPAVGEKPRQVSAETAKAAPPVFDIVQAPPSPDPATSTSLSSEAQDTLQPVMAGPSSLSSGSSLIHVPGPSTHLISQMPAHTLAQASDLEEVFKLKLNQDLKHSVCHDRQIFDSSQRDCRKRIEFTLSRATVNKPEGRVDIHEVGTFPLLPASAGGSTHAILAERFKGLIRFTQERPIIINSQSIELAAIGVLLGMRDEFGINLQFEIDSPSGRPQVFALTRRDDADFLITADGAFFLSGEGGALNYVHSFPIHLEHQKLLRVPGGLARGQKRCVLVYIGSSIEEQWLMWEKGWFVDNPNSFSPARKQAPTDEVLAKLKAANYETVTSLSGFLDQVRQLRPGDLTFAWEPLASRFEGLLGLKQYGPDHWNFMSMYCHRRWRDESLLACYREDFKAFFLHEWKLARRNPDQLIQVLNRNSMVFDEFTLGAGAPELQQ